MKKQTTAVTPAGTAYSQHAYSAATSTKPGAIPQAIINFDSLPDAARVDIRVVTTVAGRSPASIWRDVAAGRMPAPVKVGPRATRWIVGELRRYLAGEFPQADRAPLPKRQAKDAAHVLA